MSVFELEFPLNQGACLNWHDVRVLFMREVFAQLDPHSAILSISSNIFHDSF